MNIALVSLDQAWEDKESNLIKCEKYIKEASLHDAELIIFPEMTLTGFSLDTNLISEDESSSITITHFKKLSKEYNIAIIFGVVIKEEIKSSNRVYFINNLGEIVDYYKKIHPFSFANEDKYYIGGNELKTIDYKGIKFGLTICYDLRFSNLYFELAKLNTSCIINIANWPKKRVDHWNTLLKARAIETQQFIIGVNRIGIDGNQLEYLESSNIFDANGDKVPNTKEIKGMKIMNIDIKKREMYQSQFNTFQDIKDLKI